MSRNFGYALAVPLAALDQGGNGSSLAIDTASWAHLAAYLDTVARLPAGFGEGQPEIGAAIAQVRREVQRFGTPQQARLLLRDQPRGAPGALPAAPYVGLIAWIGRLHESAASVVQILQRAVDSPNAVADVKQRLQSLSQISAAVMAQILPLKETLGSSKAMLLGANRALSQAGAESGGLLQRTQEAVGAMQVQVASLEAHIANLGMLEAYKKPAMMQRLLTLKASLDVRRALAEQLRLQHGAIEAILKHGAWLDAALDDTAGFLERSRSAWSAFGSGAAQLGADATPEELADKALMEQRLDRDKAIVQWSALDQAAKLFAVQALADTPDGVLRKGYGK